VSQSFRACALAALTGPCPPVGVVGQDHFSSSRTARDHPLSPARPAQRIGRPGSASTFSRSPASGRAPITSLLSEGRRILGPDPCLTLTLRVSELRLRAVAWPVLDGVTFTVAPGTAHWILRGPKRRRAKDDAFCAAIAGLQPPFRPRIDGCRRNHRLCVEAMRTG